MNSRTRCAAMAYDYTVFAGTQGLQNHRKTDRLIDIAKEGRMPLVVFAEGGGGRPGDTDVMFGDFSVPTFRKFAQLNGVVPLVGMASGRCFAGNASLLGCCDVIIATKNSNIGMAGPAMIEGGGLGVFKPEDIGPADNQFSNGVVDILVDDEKQGVEVCRRYLSYFQGETKEWRAAEQTKLRSIIPENRMRVYQVRKVIEGMVDTGSFLELRSGFGVGMVTGLGRIAGKPLGIMANNPIHLGGAIDADAADKGARFMQLCDAFDLPILSLCDTPGIMVGPEAEKTALVRHANRLFVTGANVKVPIFTVVLRKSYGLGALAMGTGCFRDTALTISWPSGEFGGMGLEGAVRLGFRRELEAVRDDQERQQLYDKLVASAYERGKALNIASFFEVDDVIDPADTRDWLLQFWPDVSSSENRWRPIDTW